MSKSQPLAVRAIQAREKLEASQKPEPIFRPDAIYFDSNPLIAAGWPNVSAQLLQVTQMAENLGIQLCLPETVQQELEEHRIRDIIEKHKGINSQIGKLAGNYSFLVLKYLPSLPPSENLRKELQKSAAPLAAHFSSVPPTPRPLTEFVNLAIRRGATFEEGGRGFQDAVIFCSVLDHMKSSKFERACFVSEDHAFQSGGCAELIRASAVNLKVVSTLDDLEKLLNRNLNTLVLAYLDKEQRILREAISKHETELQAFLDQNLEIAPTEVNIRGTVKKLLSVGIVSIKDVHLPLTKKVQALSPAKANVSVNVKVVLTLEVERFYPGEPEKIKVGGAVHRFEPTLRNAIRLEVIEHTGMVLVEMEAKKSESGYSEFRFLSARLISETLYWHPDVFTSGRELGQ
jgi:PIN domain